MNEKKGIASVVIITLVIVIMFVVAVTVAAIVIFQNSIYSIYNDLGVEVPTVDETISKASWSQISADRANLQVEYAYVLAEAMTNSEQDVPYESITTEEVVNSDEYKEWEQKVKETNSRFTIYVPEDGNPSGIKITLKISRKEASEFSLEYDEETNLVSDYDWVIVE